MTTEVYQERQGEEITDDILEAAAKLFSEHYGVWGTPPPGHAGFHGRSGQRVRMNAARLRKQCLPPGSRCSYVSVTVDDVLAGNAFACRWEYNGRQVCWVTQLVVHSDYRERRLATTLLGKLRRGDDEVFGIMSSHPAACVALTKACADESLPHISLEFARKYAASVMELSPVSYVKDAKLCGSLYTAAGSTGTTVAPNVGEDSRLVSTADSAFFVDHEEPLDALAWLRERIIWPLGDLPDGHEFLLVFESMRRWRRSRSSGRSNSG